MDDYWRQIDEMKRNWDERNEELNQLESLYQALFEKLKSKESRNDNLFQMEFERKIEKPHVITKKYVNSNINGLPFTRVKSTAKTRRPQSRSNSKNDRIPSASKSSCLSNNLEKVEGHHKTILFSKTPNHSHQKVYKTSKAEYVSPFACWSLNSLGRNEQDYNSTPKLMKKMRIVAGDGVRNTSDAVRISKRRRQDI
nr:hypothetical protein [Tanacetum cinerariifolium]